MKNKAGKIIAVVMLAPILLFGLVYGTMLLWNWLMPYLFNLPVLSFWQTAGLLLLSKILLGGFGFRNKGKAWKERFQDKYECMSEDEREAFKQKMKEKCSKWSFGSEVNIEAGNTRVHIKGEEH
jgi:hypothetical protein